LHYCDPALLPSSETKSGDTLQESLKMHLRNAFLLIPKYAVAFAAEVQVKARVLQIVQLLHNSDSVNNAMAAADGGKLSKEQRAVRARELAQQRMDQVNALTALVPVYSDAVLAYTRAFQELAVSVEAVRPLLCLYQLLCIALVVYRLTRSAAF
jgi:hypothetical protein